MQVAEQLVDKLCRASRRQAVDPYVDLIDRYPEKLAETEWLMPPELISLYAHPVYEQLTEAQKRKLSFYEMINLFSFTLHGERMQCEGLVRRLYDEDLIGETAYLHHFLDEENNHMTFFGNFCLRYAGKIYPPLYKGESMSKEGAPGEEHFMFFLKLMMFEEIGDAYNVAIARDERVEATVREINLRHHEDEVRHIGFGRKLVKQLFETYSPRWSDEDLARIRRIIQDFLAASWWEFYNVKVYKDAGLPGDLFDLRDDALDLPKSSEHRKKMSSKVIKFLDDTGILSAVKTKEVL